jgi:uncharacterized protein
MKYPAMGVVYLWRWTLGPLFAGSCKYHPSCSQYALDALRSYGLVRGSILAGWRLLRCNPWSHGGVDFVSDQKLFRR